MIWPSDISKGQDKTTHVLFPAHRRLGRSWSGCMQPAANCVHQPASSDTTLLLCLSWKYIGNDYSKHRLPACTLARPDGSTCCFPWSVGLVTRRRRPIEGLENRNRDVRDWCGGGNRHPEPFPDLALLDLPTSDIIVRFCSRPMQYRSACYISYMLLTE